MGYWAYFDQATIVQLPASGTTSGVPLPVGQWVMVGRPPFAGAAARGADVLDIYDPATRRYTETSFLSPGQGAWALSNTGGVFMFGFPGAPAR